MSNRKESRKLVVNIGNIKSELRKMQFGFGIKNKPRHRQLVKVRNEEHIHELKSNY